MVIRDRSNGWKHAKISGHSNEVQVKNLLCNNSSYFINFMERINYNHELVEEITIGGLNETCIPSVLNKKTKSKIDLMILCENNHSIGISIKKSKKGQVYLIPESNFIEIYQKQFNEKIPDNVIRAIELFWSSADDVHLIINEFADKYDDKSYELQKKHNSINGKTLKTYDDILYSDLLEWFSKKSSNIARLVFSMGGAKNNKDYAKYIWYKNLLGENDLDKLFNIDDLCLQIENSNHKAYFGDKNGGTTIQLPFGFVQWHQKKMQFHHDYEKINQLFSKK